MRGSILDFKVNYISPPHAWNVFHTLQPWWNPVHFAGVLFSTLTDYPDLSAITHAEERLGGLSEDPWTPHNTPETAGSCSKAHYSSCFIIFTCLGLFLQVKYEQRQGLKPAGGCVYFGLGVWRVHMIYYLFGMSDNDRSCGLVVDCGGIWILYLT